QKEASNWYFGDSAAITFNSNPPTSLNNSAMFTYRGCATMSDSRGNLLFYTHGSTVYNKNHQVMDNGDNLMGGRGSSQSAIIIPAPNQKNLYYIFTVDDVPTQFGTGTGSFRYSLVDMKANNGIGKLIQKNIFIYSNMVPKITAVKHANSSSVWIITHYDNSNGFAAFLLTKQGISSIPINTFIGTNCTAVTTVRGAGRMKISPDGKILAVPWYHFHTLELLKFDNLTGKLSNLVSLYTFGTDATEFSPNGKLLYYTEQPIFGRIVLQVNITSLDSVQIVSSKKTLYNMGNSWGIQIGIDGKIYITNEYYIDCIELPNKSDTFCRYNDSAIYLNGNKCLYNFPDFLQSYFFKPDFEAIGTCFSDTTQFYIQDSSQVDSLFWIFDDSISGTNNFSNSWAPQHYFSDTGVYNVQMIVYHDTFADTSAREIRISPYPNANFSINDNAQCLSSNFFQFTNTTSITSGTCTYEWNYGDTATSYYTNASHSFSYEDSFYVKMYALSDYGCEDSILKTVYVFPPKADFEITDSAQCFLRNNFEFINKTSNNFGTIQYLWQFGDGDTSNVVDTVYHSYQTSDTFSVTLIANSNFGCSDTLTKQLIVHPMPQVDFSINDSLQCFNENNFQFLNLTTFNQLDSLNYNWALGDSTFSTDTNINQLYQKSDTFTIELIVTSNHGCSDTATKNVIVLESPKAKININDTAQCFNENNFTFLNPSDSLNLNVSKTW
ncbi:MAG: PKD domain-containing protein, partial [Bacteroidota bacterium]|nr:PKD domain-containing protein [Bacteroidota bacterium]